MRKARFTTDSLNREMETLENGEYIFLDPYKSMHTRMKILHKPCGTIYTTDVSKFVDVGQGRCKLCRTKSHAEHFFSYVKKMVGNEYTFTGKYVDMKTKIHVRHNVCGREYDISPNQFMTNGVRCEKCSRKLAGKKLRESAESVSNRVNTLHNGAYLFVDTFFKNKLRMLTVTHKKCGTTYTTRADTFFRGAECKKCTYEKFSKEYVKKTAEYANEISEVTDGEYSLLGEYTSVNTKVTLKHNSCGNIYEVFPYQFKRGKRCPKCSSMSYGEHYIEKALEKHSIMFIQQVTFPDCSDISNLSYDFQVGNFLIEYQGQQHYHPVDLFGGKEQFSKQQKHDNIKRAYALSKGYSLIEIPYTVSSYEDIESFLISKKVIV